MAVVVDDHVLLDVLAGGPPAEAVDDLERGLLYTTGSWYYRLGRALNAGGAGTLSSRLVRHDPAAQERVLDKLRELPDEVGLVSPRVSVPLMIGLRVRRPLNLLNADALAVALVAEATLIVSTDAPLLRAGAADLEVPYVVLDERRPEA